MYLDLKDIGPEGRSFDGNVPVPDSDRYPGETIRVRSARLAVRVVREAGRLELAGRLVARVELACSRCLEPLEWPLDTPIVLRLVPDGSDEEGADAVESGLGNEEGDEWRLEGTSLDLVRLVEEFVFLDLPLKPVCRPDCKGLCPRCGVDRNQTACGCGAEVVDPRLAPLLDLKKRLGSE
jgi:uncharacterized protein